MIENEGQVAISVYDHNEYVAAHPQLTPGDEDMLNTIFDKTKTGVPLTELATFTRALTRSTSEGLKKLNSLQRISLESWIRSYLIETIGEDSAFQIFSLWRSNQ